MRQKFILKTKAAATLYLQKPLYLFFPTFIFIFRPSLAKNVIFMICLSEVIAFMWVVYPTCPWQNNMLPNYTRYIICKPYQRQICYLVIKHGETYLVLCYHYYVRSTIIFLLHWYSGKYRSIYLLEVNIFSKAVYHVFPKLPLNELPWYEKMLLRNLNENNLNKKS